MRVMLVRLVLCLSLLIATAVLASSLARIM
jgi:hypothetical protein